MYIHTRKISNIYKCDLTNTSTWASVEGLPIKTIGVDRDQIKNFKLKKGKLRNTKTLR